MYSLCDNMLKRANTTRTRKLTFQFCKLLDRVSVVVLVMLLGLDFDGWRPYRLDLEHPEQQKRCILRMLVELAFRVAEVHTVSLALPAPPPVL